MRPYSLNRRVRSRLILLVASQVGLLCACGEAGPLKTAKTATGPLDVYTVNVPLHYFADRLGGAEVRVRFPMVSSGDPAHWEPTESTIQAFQAADLVIRNGAGYAAWIDKVSLSDARVVDASNAIADRLVEIKDTITHRHGPAGAHSHSGYAFTIWLDPLLALEQGASIKRALQQRLPGSATAIETRYEGLAKDLRALDARIQKIVAQDPKRPLLASHPVYQYLQARYGLSLQSLHWEPDAEPPAEAWAALAKILERHKAKLMLWEAEPLPATRSRLADMGVTCVVYDPCASKSALGDFLQRMQENLNRLERAWL